MPRLAPGAHPVKVTLQTGNLVGRQGGKITRVKLRVCLPQSVDGRLPGQPLVFLLLTLIGLLLRFKQLGVPDQQGVKLSIHFYDICQRRR